MDRPSLWGINHLKLATAKIEKTLTFYTNVLGFGYIAEYDHRIAQGELFAVMVKLKHLGEDIIVEIRHNEQQAIKQEGWDPITWGVESRTDLETWRSWFKHNGVKCSKVFVGLKGWVLCALDPDGKTVRLYCNEKHEWTTDFDHDEFWLGE